MAKTVTLINSSDGTILGVNRKRIGQFPFNLLTDPPSTVVTVPANQSSPPQIMSVSGEGPAQILSFSHQKTGGARCILQIQDGKTQRSLMNGAIHMDALFGSYAVQAIVSNAAFAANIVTITTAAAHGFFPGQQVQISGVIPNGYNGLFVILSTPSLTTFTFFLGTNPGAFANNGDAITITRPYLLAEALYLDEIRSLVAIFTDISGASNDIRILADAQRYVGTVVADPDLLKARDRIKNRQYISMPYWYTLDQGPVILAPGATGNFSITIGSDHNFELFQMSCVALCTDAAGAPAAVGANSTLFTMDLVDTGKGESLIDAPQGVHYPIPSSLIFGNGAFPFRFHEPRIFLSNQRILVTLVNQDLVNSTQVFLSFGGRALADKMWQ